MNRRDGLRPTLMLRRAHDQRGLTVVEILVATALMMIIAGAIAILMGAAVQSKMISASWSAETQSARITLAWMAERLRQAGFNVLPGEVSPYNQAGYQARCHDRVVAQDVLLLPTANSVYISGEIPYVTGTTPGSNVVTIGYYLATDAGTGNQVIMEYNQTCVGATSVAAHSTRLSNPKVNVTALTFTYYDGSGAVQTPPFSTSTYPPAGPIRSIQIISISLTVKSTEGKYGKQTEIYLNRYVRLWEPEPYANNDSVTGPKWVDFNENY